MFDTISPYQKEKTEGRVLKVKKLFALVLAVSVFGSLFIGCNPEQAGITTVRIWTADGANKLHMTQRVDTFNETIGREKGIKIEYRVIRDNIDAVVKDAFEKGNPPEIFGGGGTAVSELRQKGRVIPITALPGGQEYLDSLDGYDFISYKLPGKDESAVYGYMTRVLTGRLIYNKDLFRKAGIVDENGEPTPPKTWEEFIAYSKRIHDSDKTKFGTAFPFKEPSLFSYGLGWAMEASFGARYVPDYENKTCRDLYAENILKVLQQLKEDGSCFPAAEKLDNDTLRHQFAEGNIGMFFACSWDVGVLTEQFPAKCDWGVAYYPTLEEGVVYPVHKNSSGTLSISHKVLESEKMQRAVLEVHKWYYSDESILSQYQAEQWIPTNENVINMADESKLSRQWLDFCKDPATTAERGGGISLKTGAGYELYLRAWRGEISFEEAVREANEAATRAFRKTLADDAATDKQ